jgi:NAD(P)-dependent dehydrogenase (short-subunit alcohol dehydrogenase family)
MRLLGKIAIVTGAVQGIGRSIADRFVKEGALVAMGDYKSIATALLDGQSRARDAFTEYRRCISNSASGNLR